jgi:hypothetical protein
VALAHALDVVGAVKVSSDRLVLPAEYLRAALQQCLLLQLNEMVVLAEVSSQVHCDELHKTVHCTLCLVLSALRQQHVIGFVVTLCF